MGRIVMERAKAWKLQPYVKGQSPEGTHLIAYVNERLMDDTPVQGVRNVPIPYECWDTFKRNPVIHYIELAIGGTFKRYPLALAGRILPDKWLPKGLTWYGRMRIILYWYWQKLLGNV